MSLQEHPTSLLDASERQELETLVCVYRDAKAIILYCEEVDPTFKSNLQIIKELRDAFDHLMRLFISKINGAPEDDKYGKAQIDKAIGHTYRAAFDALDGTVLSLRLKIKEALSCYHIDVIKEIIPDYWKIKSTLNKLTEHIATNRAEKDIQIDYSALFERYVTDVEDLKNAYDHIISQGLTLDECQATYTQKKKDEDKRSLKLRVAGGIIILIISMMSAFLVGKFSSSSEPPVHPTTESKSDTLSPSK